MKNTYDFVKESNRIENILRPPTKEEIEGHNTFISLSIVTIQSLINFVAVYQPTAKLRDKPGLNVRVANYIPPPGGQQIVYKLQELLDNLGNMTPYSAHVAYEKLHPFTDGNGRSGRALWAWHMIQTEGSYPLGFLHHFYYQSLNESRDANQQINSDRQTAAAGYFRRYTRSGA